MSYKYRAGLAILLFAFVILPCCRRSNNAPFDILITGGSIIDGSGNPWFKADIGIVGDSIKAVGNLRGAKAKSVTSAEGLFVAPGFIDMHTHCDSGFGRPETQANINYITQGVTTVVTGNCGTSPLFGPDTIALWQKQGMGTNAAVLLGLGSVREKVIGDVDRAPTPGEMETMKDIVRSALGSGAFGVSTGLQYIPGKYTSTDEIIELARVAALLGGIYCSHLRSEEERLLEAVQEAIRIGEGAGVRVNVSHFKSSGRPNWGRLSEAARLLREARARGLEITADIYPYDKSATTTLETIFNVPKDTEPLASIRSEMAKVNIKPAELAALESRYADELAKALSDPRRREQIRRLTEVGESGEVNWVAKGGWDNFTLMFSRSAPQFVGRMFRDLAHELHRPEFDIAADLYVKDKRDLFISLSAMSEEDVRVGLSQTWSMVSSDGEAMGQGTELVHPRNYGTFPRVLARYVRETGLLGLEEAVRKMTSLPAQTLRLADRGWIRPGCRADIVIFDPLTIQDRATFMEPRQFSTGISFVLVNGHIAIEKGKYNGTLGGRVLLSARAK